jgi:hypothetical protein
MNADGNAVDSAKLITFFYRNFKDYSIWQYTAEIFISMDLNSDAAIDEDEYNKWRY